MPMSALLLYKIPTCYQGAHDTTHTHMHAHTHTYTHIHTHAHTHTYTHTGAACYRAGVIGHVGLDFVTLQEESSGALRLWAVDADLQPTPSLASYQLFDFLTVGEYNPANGTYCVELAPVESTHADSRPSSSASLGSASAAGLGPMTATTTCCNLHKNIFHSSREAPFVLCIWALLPKQQPGTDWPLPHREKVSGSFPLPAVDAPLELRGLIFRSHQGNPQKDDDPDPYPDLAASLQSKSPTPHA
eukprot:scaffold58420_cov21-Tisochrysis_lutea.AAC.4